MTSKVDSLKFVVTGSKSVFLSAILLFGIAPLQAQEPAKSFDIVITNSQIIDGTGSPWYSGDVGIRGGKIAAIGNLSAAARSRTIDAGGKVVAPGFIDMLGQSEDTILVEPRLPSKIYQGITTEITGEGESIAPLNDAIVRADREHYDQYHIRADWRTETWRRRLTGFLPATHQLGRFRTTGSPVLP